MRPLYRNKYVIGSKRLSGYDYTLPGKYFVTICTNDKIPYFGNILNGAVVLSEMGKIADKLWREIPEHCKNTGLDQFVVMPDHIHGIIIIQTITEINDTVETTHASFPHAQSIIPDHPPSNNHNPGNSPSISMKPGSLGSIIGSYKSAVSKQIHLIDPDFRWQTRYYDHIIRTNQHLMRIRNYIRDNPVNISKKSK